MSRLVLVLALFVAGISGTARAEPASPPRSERSPRESDTGSNRMTPRAPGIGFAGKRPPAGTRWGDGKTDGTQPTAEPARGSSYNYTQMAYGSVIMLAMLAFTIWLIRRHTRR
jgi:hypothetical protein